MDTTTWLCGPPAKTGRKQQYPSRFLNNLKTTYPQVFDPKKNLLHMFCGTAEWGFTTDQDERSEADLVCLFQDLTSYFDPGTFDFVIADPPYADHYAKEWHAELPKPKHILKVASELTCPGGLILILHIIVVPAYKIFNVERVALHPILTGTNNAVRVLNVFRKKDKNA